MGAEIKVTRTTPEQHRENGCPSLATIMTDFDITGDITLMSDKANSATMVYEYCGCRFKFVTGSKALFNRWIRENDLRVTT